MMTENKRVQTLLKAHRGVSDDDTRLLLLEVVTASHKLLERLEEMTSDDFRLGGEQEEREALADLIIFEGETMPFVDDETGDPDTVREDRERAENHKVLRDMVRESGHGGI